MRANLKDKLLNLKDKLLGQPEQIVKVLHREENPEFKSCYFAVCAALKCSKSMEMFRKMLGDDTGSP